MQIDATAIADVLILTPRRFADDRGFFSEVWNRETLRREAGIDAAFVQDNQSLTRAPGTVRGLHCQTPPRAQAKLVRCGRGAVRDVAADIRKGSATYGQWVAVELSAENGRQLYIPEGFLHGFVTLTPDAELLYKCTDTYAPECDVSIRYDDPDLAIDWGVTVDAGQLSAKDRDAPTLAAFDNPFVVEVPR